MTFVGLVVVKVPIAWVISRCRVRVVDPLSTLLNFGDGSMVHRQWFRKQLSNFKNNTSNKLLSVIVVPYCNLPQLGGTEESK